MSEGHISPISPYSPGKVKGKGSSVKKLEKKETSQPSVLGDKVELKKVSTPKEEQSLVSEGEMSRYLKMLKELPDLRPEEVERVQEDLAKGVHGQQALADTVQGVGEDLGILPPNEG